MFLALALPAFAQEQLELPSQTTVELVVQVSGELGKELPLAAKAGEVRIEATTDAQGKTSFRLPVETQVDLFILEHHVADVLTPEAGYRAAVELNWPPAFTLRFVELDGDGEVPPRGQRVPLVGQDFRIEPVDGSAHRMLSTDKEGYLTVDWMMPGEQFHLVHIPPLGDDEDAHRWPRPMEITAASQVRIVGYSAGYSLRLEHMNFALGKSTFAPETREETHAYLDQQARELKVYFQHHPEGLIEVQGHTDSTGSEEANQRLSQARADTVADRLVARGVPADRVRAVGKGEAEPLADNETEEGRALNRRVELHFVTP